MGTHQNCGGIGPLALQYEQYCTTLDVRRRIMPQRTGV